MKNHTLVLMSMIKEDNNGILCNCQQYFVIIVSCTNFSQCAVF
jgi:hypothetical protein